MRLKAAEARTARTIRDGVVYLAMRACLLHTPQVRIAVNVKPLLYSAAILMLPYRARIKRDNKNIDVDI